MLEEIGSNARVVPMKARGELSGAVREEPL